MGEGWKWGKKWGKIFKMGAFSPIGGYSGRPESWAEFGPTGRAVQNGRTTGRAVP